MQRLKWWRLGSKDDNEHGFRSTLSNQAIKLIGVKNLHKQSENLLKDHFETQKYYQQYESKTNKSQGRINEEDSNKLRKSVSY